MSDRTSNELQSHDIKASPQARGKRVETLRRMTHLSRRAFQEKYGIAPSTLQNWEDVKGNGLTEKGARRILTLLKPSGIHCSFEWLMYGVGPGPQISEQFYIEEPVAPYQANKSTPDENTQEALIAQELLLFHQHNPKTAIDFVVPDDSMEPRFIKGEQVAGCRSHGKDIEKLVGLDCIVQTSEGDVLLRTIKKVSPDGRYTLTCSNPNTAIEKPILYDVELLNAAPVIWARRKNPLT